MFYIEHSIDSSLDYSIYIVFIVTLKNVLKSEFDTLIYRILYIEKETLTWVSLWLIVTLFYWNQTKKIHISLISRVCSRQELFFSLKFNRLNWGKSEIFRMKLSERLAIWYKLNGNIEFYFHTFIHSNQVIWRERSKRMLKVKMLDY